jgi:RimJ/RimL family protein N-acetyltransferase
MSLNRAHQKVLDHCNFERWGEDHAVLKSDEYDDCRVIYAITNPEKTVGRVRRRP